jgi:hypothetical protein
MKPGRVFSRKRICFDYNFTIRGDNNIIEKNELPCVTENHEVYIAGKGYVKKLVYFSRYTKVY